MRIRRKETKKTKAPQTAAVYVISCYIAMALNVFTLHE